MKDSCDNQVVILAAGVGSRLRPLTSVKPKPLIHVGGEAIIDRQIKSFLANGIRRITVVVGYRAISVIKYLSARFPYPDCEISYLYNPIFSKTNTVYSLWLASFNFHNNTTIVANGDLILTPSSVSKIVLCENSCLGLSVHKCGAEEVKVEVNGGFVSSIGKGLDPAKVQGEYVGIAKFDKDFGRAYHQALDATVSSGKFGLYYDDVIQSLLHNYGVKAVDLTQDWVLEIDSLEDLDNANKVFSFKSPTNP